MKQFTVQEGEKVQERQLKEWKALLKEEVYIALVIYARKNNHLATDGYDIVRGSSLDNFIGNFLRNKRDGKLEEVLGLRGYEQYESMLEG